MTVRSTRLAAVNIVTGANTTLFTCPAGWRTILKDINWYTTGGTPSNFGLVMITADQTVLVYLQLANPLPSVVGQWQGWSVMHPGDILLVNGTTHPMSVWVSGTLLQLTGAEPPMATTLPQPPLSDLSDWPVYPSG